MNPANPHPVCWVEGASSSGFPLSGLPYGVARFHNGHRVVAAIGHDIIDIAACLSSGLISVEGLLPEALQDTTLNRLLSHTKAELASLRRALQNLFCDLQKKPLVMDHMMPRSQAELVCPIAPGEFVDFYASYHHAHRSNLAAGLEPFEPAANWKSMPLAYYSRASSIVGSGALIHRPKGLIRTPRGAELSKTRALDFELEIGIVTCGPAERQHIHPSQFSDRVFGLVLLNDWSARDIQAWESKPLGPFNAKSFATQIGNWVLPIEALDASRYKSEISPELAEHLHHDHHWGVNLHLEVELKTQHARKRRLPGDTICTSNLNCLHWDLAQLVSHATLNAPLVRGADLFGTGTLSGSELSNSGCLLELTNSGRQPIVLSTKEARAWIEDGDTIIFRGHTESISGEPLSIGELIGTVV